MSLSAVENNIALSQPKQVEKISSLTGARAAFGNFIGASAAVAAAAFAYQNSAATLALLPKMATTLFAWSPTITFGVPAFLAVAVGALAGGFLARTTAPTFDLQEIKAALGIQDSEIGFSGLEGLIDLSNKNYFTKNMQVTFKPNNEILRQGILPAMDQVEESLSGSAARISGAWQKLGLINEVVAIKLCQFDSTEKALQQIRDFHVAVDQEVGKQEKFTKQIGTVLASDSKGDEIKGTIGEALEKAGQQRKYITCAVKEARDGVGDLEKSFRDGAGIILDPQRDYEALVQGGREFLAADESGEKKNPEALLHRYFKACEYANLMDSKQLPTFFNDVLGKEGAGVSSRDQSQPVKKTSWFGRRSSASGQKGKSPTKLGSSEEIIGLPAARVASGKEIQKKTAEEARAKRTEQANQNSEEYRIKVGQLNQLQAHLTTLLRVQASLQQEKHRTLGKIVGMDSMQTLGALKIAFQSGVNVLELTQTRDPESAALDQQIETLRGEIDETRRQIGAERPKDLKHAEKRQQQETQKEERLASQYREQTQKLLKVIAGQRKEIGRIAEKLEKGERQATRRFFASKEVLQPPKVPPAVKKPAKPPAGEAPPVTTKVEEGSLPPDGREDGAVDPELGSLPPPEFLQPASQKKRWIWG